MQLFHSAKSIFILLILILFSACVSKKNLVQEAKINTTDVNELLNSTYMPSKKDMLLIMKNANTGNYYLKNDACTFNPNKVIIKFFEDSLMTIIKPTIIIQYYKNGLEIKHDQYESNKLVSSFEYIRNAAGLLLKTVHIVNGKEIYITEYRYEQDKIFEINITNNYITDYNTCFLNDIKQCYRKINQDPSHEIYSDRTFSYDNLGRQTSQRNINSELIYSYLNKSDNFYSTLKRYDLESNKFQGSSEILKNGNINTYLSKNEKNEILFKSIYITDPNCTTKTYDYNSKNELIDVSLYIVE